MKNVFLYYTATLIPAILLAMYWNYMPPKTALSLLLFYSVIYRTWLDGIRLSSKGLIEKHEIWKLMYNGMRRRYFKELYLQK